MAEAKAKAPKAKKSISMLDRWATDSDFVTIVPQKKTKAKKK
jgi:hypothetical protein